ncbi:MAG: DUF1178 family protein [Cypionkella sp.]
MIVFDLACRDGHRFEGWFASSEKFAEQQTRGLVDCPHCGSRDVAKAPMAPAVPAKGNALAEPPRRPAPNPLPPQVAAAMHALAAAQAKALKDSTWVGDAFAERSRAMHYGEQEHSLIHGRATREEAAELAEEGIPVAPLLIPVAAPDELN